MKVLAPCPPTPVPPTSAGSGRTTRLSDEILSEQVKRLAVLSAVGIGLWSFGLLQDQVLVPLVGVRDIPSVNYLVSLSGILISAAMLVYVRFSPHDPSRKMDVGLGYMLVNAFLVALLNSWVVVPTESSLMRLSWVGVIILIYPMIAAVSPRKMLVAALAAAAMDPLCVWLAYLRGLPVPSVAGTLVLYLPNFVLAVVAVVPTQLVNKLRRSLHEAQRLGSYELVERLGEGGMGEVWRARHRLLAREAAVKLVRPEVLGVSDGESRVALRRFEREARATASLNSPHTIGVFDFGLSNDGLFYYVMELLAGMDLETLVRQFGPLPPERAVFLLRQVSHSLADAHARGMVHRDIKPANIYVCRMGLDYDFIKVLDFGLVKLRTRPDQPVIGQTLAMLDHGTTGTPAYMAPEIILGEHDVDRRADVYALGCVAYYLLTGQLVFDADSPMKMLMHHVQSRPLPPSQRTELAIPRELDQLVLACLEKDPERRPQDAGALFRMTGECRTCNSWDQNAALTWWEAHLPELTGPLTLGEPDTGMVERVALLPR
jgi:serine/threonine-protein kinase